jgi:hypothetical protein
MKYFFHNVYGDADGLIRTAPDDVQVQAFGWDEETEAARDSLLAELDKSGVSALPCVLYWHPEREVPALLEGEAPLVIPARYEEIRLDELDEPWNWGAIDAEIERRIRDWPNI